MAQYAPQGDDFMAYPGSNAAPGYMAGDSQNPSFMNMHDSQSGQSYNPSFQQGGYGSAPGFQDQNFDQGGGYGGEGSYHDGNSPFVGGQPSHDGNSSFVGGQPSHDGNSSFVGGHPSTMDGDSRPEDESFVGGHPSTQSHHSIPGNLADGRNQNSFNASADGSRSSNLQVERISDAIHRETQGAVDGFAATLRILAELARRETSFSRGQRFVWRFITLAEAAEAGGDPSSAALRDAGESTQNRLLIEVHGMLGGRGADISVHLESLERDARLDASDDWGIDSPVNALSESQGIAFDQVEIHRRGPPPTLADGLKRLGKPVQRGASGTSVRGGPGGSTPSGRGGAGPSGGAGRGRGPSPSPRGGGVARGRGGTSGGPFKSTGQPGF